MKNENIGISLSADQLSTSTKEDTRRFQEGIERNTKTHFVCQAKTLGPLTFKKYENKVIFLTPAGFNSKNTESCGAGICWEVFQGIMEQYLRKTCFILGELGRIFPV